MHPARLIALCLSVILSLTACRRREPERATALRAPDLPAALPGDQPGPSGGDEHAGEKLTIMTGFAPVVERVAGAVVNISSTRIVNPPSTDQLPFFNDPLFRDLLGRLQPPQRTLRERALGSGVIVSPDGYVLTNVHVVQGASDIRVSLPDRRELKGTVVGQDPKTDIAVLRIPGNGFPYLHLGDSTKVRVGDFAIAIGNPLGLGQTVTMGIISAKGRGNVGIVDYEDFIQTDAAINPGNSGGALVDAAAELIGINTAIATSGGGQGNQGIGFAVPSNLAREVLHQIQKNGRVIRGWMGVAIQDLTPDMTSALGLKTQNGALVSDVTPGSPAAKAGLARGDVVVEVDNQAVADSRSFRLIISELAPGTRVSLGVLRHGARRTVEVNLGEMPSEPQKPGAQAPSATGALGIQIAPLTPDLARRLDVPEGTNGVVVTGVQQGSRAAELGLRPGDVIQEIDNNAVRSPQDVKKALESNGKRAHVLLVLREGVTHFVAVPPEGE
jgi:serine protease Do